MVIMEVTEGTHLDSMLKAEELPTGISKLDAGLTNMDRKTFSHNETKKIIKYFNYLLPLGLF
jgi:hypothetical protein